MTPIYRLAGWGSITILTSLCAGLRAAMLIADAETCMAPSCTQCCRTRQYPGMQSERCKEMANIAQDISSGQVSSWQGMALIVDPKISHHHHPAHTLRDAHASLEVLHGCYEDAVLGSSKNSEATSPSLSSLRPFVYQLSPCSTDHPPSAWRRPL